MLFEAIIEILLLLPIISGFQALLGFLGLVRAGISIHNTHIMNTVRPLRIEVYDEETPLQISIVF